MDIGKILRDKANFATYRSEPKSTKYKKWGIYPVVKVDKNIFFEEDEFICQVYLFSYKEDEILKMQDEAIEQAARGIKKNGWIFWLHAANHKVHNTGKLCRSEIRFVFKVKILEKIQQEVK